MRHVILVVGDRRRIVTGESAQEYVSGGARWTGKSKAHVNGNRYFVPNSQGCCQKCSSTTECSVVLLSVLTAVPPSARSRPNPVSPGALTANDIQRNVEGNRRAQEKAIYYDKLDDGRPASLDPRMLWVKLYRTVCNHEGLQRQWRILGKDGSDMLWPKGNCVHVALHPKTPETSKIARDYVNWITLALEDLFSYWSPPPEMLDPETQEFKQDLVEADVVRILAELGNIAERNARPPKEIDKIWPAIVVKFAAGQYSKKLNTTKASDLPISTVQHFLQEYLRL
jgi:hypothetical protein